MKRKTSIIFPASLTAAALLMGTIILPACNIISGSNSVNVQGRRLTESSLSQIEEGKTTTDWLEAAFGIPSSRNGYSNDGVSGEIWRYEYRRTQSSSGELLFIYDGWKHKEEVETTCFDIQDGRVVRYWTERAH